MTPWVAPCTFKVNQRRPHWSLTSLAHLSNITLAAAVAAAATAAVPTNPIKATIINVTTSTTGSTTTTTTTSFPPIQALDQCASEQITPISSTNVSYPSSASSSSSSSSSLSVREQNNDEHLYVRLSTFWYCFLAFITSLGLVVSLVSNMIIIYLFTGTPSLRRNPTNIIAVNLSLSDLLYCIQWPSVIYCSLTQTTWLLEIDYVCQTFGFITLITASASILTVLAMSIERALVIRYTLHARNRLAMRHAWLVLLLIWFISLAISLPPLYGTFNKYTLDPSKTSCTLDYLSSKPKYKLYTLILYIAYWFVPTVIITICYAQIIRTFVSSSRSLTLAGGGGGDKGLTRAACNTVDVQPPHSMARGLVTETQTAAARETQTRVCSLSCDPGECENVTRGLLLRRPNDHDQQRPLKSSLSLRLTTRNGPAAASQNDAHSTSRRRRWHHRRRRCRCLLRDSIRLHNMMANDAPNLQMAHSEPMDKRAYRIVTAPQDNEEETQFVGAATSSSLNLVCTMPLALAQENVHSSDGETSGQSDMMLQPTKSNVHQVDSIVESVQMSPPNSAQDTQGKRVVSATTLSWCWQKFIGTNFKDTKFLSNTSGRYRLPSLGPAAAAPRGTRTPNLDMSVSTIGGGGGSTTTTTSAASQQAGGTASGSLQEIGHRPRLRSVSCHFGGSGAHLSRASMQIRLAKMSFYLILLWLVSWTPIASLALINSLVKCHHRASALAVFLANTMTKLGPALDVFIYGISHPKIKKKFKQIIKWLLMFGSGGCASPDSERRTDSARDRNVSLRSKRPRPNESLAIY